MTASLNNATITMVSFSQALASERSDGWTWNSTSALKEPTTWYFGYVYYWKVGFVEKNIAWANSTAKGLETALKNGTVIYFTVTDATHSFTNQTCYVTDLAVDYQGENVRYTSVSLREKR
jgi:hypothetical protein